MHPIIVIAAIAIKERRSFVHNSGCTVQHGVQDTDQTLMFVIEHGSAGATHEGLIRWTSRLRRRPPVHVGCCSRDGMKMWVLLSVRIGKLQLNN